MARTTAEFVATLRADSSQAVAEFNKAGDKIDKAMDGASSSVTRLDNAMSRLGRGLVGGVAFGQIINLSKDMVESTAKLEDTIAAAGVTFGDFSGDIEEFAKDASKNFGLSTVAALDAANQFAALGKSAGLTGQDLAGFSTEMVALAGDLSSFRGTTVEEAITAIGSGLRGESEPLRRFGVLLNDATLKARAMAMGIYAGTDALTPQQKVLAAQAEILAQTTDAQGDFARTADSTANSLKTASAEMENAKAAAGEALAPAITTLAQAVTPLLEGFSQLPGELQTVVTLSALSAGAFSSLSQALQGLGVQAKTANRLVGGVVGVIGVAATTYSLYAQQKAEATRRTDEFISALKEEGEAQETALETLALNDAEFGKFVNTLADLGFSMQDVEQYVTTNTGAIADLMSGVDGLERSTLDWIFGNNDLVTSVGDLSEQYGVGTSEIDNFVRVLHSARKGEIELVNTQSDLALVTNENVTSEGYRARGLRDLAAATDEANAAGQESTTVQDEIRQKLDDSNAAYQKQLDLVDELYASQRGTIERQRDYTDAQVELYTVMGDTNSTLDDQLKAVIDMSEEFGTLTGAALESRDGTLRQIESLDTFLSTIDPSSPLYQAIKEYRDILAEIPTNVDTLLRLNLVAGKLVTNEGDTIGVRALLGETEERAMGGPVSAGSPYLVGERGPELIVPSTSGTVIPNGALGGTTILNVTVTNPVASGEQLANELAAYTRRNGSAWLSGAR